MSMKLAVISDVHLGDPSSAMAGRSMPGGAVTLGSKYADFKDAIRNKFNGEPLDYLVLLGDVFDFSIAKYSVAYETGALFFNQIISDGLIREYRVSGSDKKHFGSIIYIPGNHDFDMWHTVEYQTNIINRMHQGKPVRPLKMSLPAFIDDRQGSPVRGFTLPHVSENAAYLPKYGDFFLDHLTRDHLYFSFGFPNLYLVTESGTIMMSHGQYLDSTWSCLGKWGLEIAKGDLHIKDPNRLDLAEMVGMNLPTSQLLCSSVGQAGPLTEVVMTIEYAVKEKKQHLLDRYLDRLIHLLVGGNRGICKSFFTWGLKLLKKRKLYPFLFRMQSARDNADYIKDKGVRSRLKDFYTSTLYELEELATAFSIDIPRPSRFISGHTHQPISWSDPADTEIRLPDGNTLKLSNTGGWLHNMTDGGEKFCGAEIFFYETGAGISSVRIV